MGETAGIGGRAALAGVGTSTFGRHLPETPLRLAATAFKAALDDAGLARDDVDGLAINMGWPLGVDYDRMAEAFGLDLRYATQTWTHGRFVTSSLQQAVMAVHSGLASVVACVCAVSFTAHREILGGDEDLEGTREEGGTHAEQPAYGMTSPAAGAALAMRRYAARYGTSPEDLAQVPLALRRNAQRNPAALMRGDLDLDDYLNARPIVEPLRLFDCCLVSDGAACVLVCDADRARDLRGKPVVVQGMQGIRAGREEFIFGPPGLGVHQQTEGVALPRARDLEALGAAGLTPADVDLLYTYDAFSPLVLFTLERFGLAPQGEAAAFVRERGIDVTGALPVNTSGGLLSEAHVSGWNSIVEMVRQLRGECGERQVPDAEVALWGTVWGDALAFTAGAA